MFYLDFSDLIPQVRILWVSYPHLDRYQIHIEPIQRYIYILYYIILNHITVYPHWPPVIFYDSSQVFQKTKHPRRSPRGTPGAGGHRLSQLILHGVAQPTRQLVVGDVALPLAFRVTILESGDFPPMNRWMEVPQTIHTQIIPICEPCMVYKNLQNWVILDKGKCWDSYSSTMVRIWDCIQSRSIYIYI